MDMITSKNVEETIRVGMEAFASRFQGGEIIALSGDLGAGKTHLVKGIAQGLGFCEEVTSPTFTLLHEYRGGRLPLYHFDLYRIQNPEEAVRMGIEDYLPSDGVTVIEWPEKIEPLLTRDVEWWTIRILDQEVRLFEKRGEK